jgi:hypothetical protein
MLNISLLVVGVGGVTVMAVLIGGLAVEVLVVC